MGGILPVVDVLASSGHIDSSSIGRWEHREETDEYETLHAEPETSKEGQEEGSQEAMGEAQAAERGGGAREQEHGRLPSIDENGCPEDG